MPARRRSPPLASLFLLATAATHPSDAEARPLLPFLYPTLPAQAPTSSDPSPAKRRRRIRNTSSGSSGSGSRSSDPSKLAWKYVNDGTEYSAHCWQLHGYSNCPRDDSAELDDSATPDPAVEATSSTTGSSPTSSGTAVSLSANASASPTATVSPYPMTFTVTNIPPGWSKSKPTSFYPRGLIIGFSVSLAALIIGTIVGCVIWRIRVARTRRDSEKALEAKKAELAEGSDSDDDDPDEEAQRQRGLRRRRRNIRVLALSGDPEKRVKWYRRRRKQGVPATSTTSSATRVEETIVESFDGTAASSASEPQRASTPLPREPTPPRPTTPPPSSTALSVPNSPPPPPPSPPSTDVLPPAYRSRGARRGRPSTAPASSVRAGKQREVPEEYLYLAGLPPGAVAEDDQQGYAESLPEVRVEVDNEDAVAAEEGHDDQDITDEVEPSRLVAAHLATDDKTLLSQLSATRSAPPTTASSSAHVQASVPSEEALLAAQIDDVEPPIVGPSTSSPFPAPPSVTPAHLFMPPTYSDPPAELPREKGEHLLPSAPPSEPEASLGPSAPPLPSAPPADEDDDPKMKPSAPPLDP